MKHIVKTAVIVAALAATGSVGADWGDCICPFIGVDYQHRWMKGNGDWNRLLPKSYPGFTGYVGAKFHENFGLEIGYDTTTEEKHDYSLGAGSTLFGTAVIPTTGFTGTEKVTLSGGHVDLIGYLPVADCTEATLALGIGWLHPRIKSTMSVSDRAGATASAIASTSGKTRAVLRLAVGLNYMVTEMVGLRAKVGYEGTSNLRVQGNNFFTSQRFNQKAFKSSVTAAVGVFVKW